MPILPLSRKQLDKLGDRLRDAVKPAPGDLALLRSVIGCYKEALEIVDALLRNLGFPRSTRLKATGTIIEKLRRERGSSLKNIHDLAGARVVMDGDLAEQDEAVRTFCGSLGAPPLVIDRRSDPRSGYRAVHVIAKVDGIPVEVQFRTALQDEWAQVFEQVGDAWGRQIRYGGRPDAHPASNEITDGRRRVVAELVSISAQIGTLEALIAADRARFRHRMSPARDGLNGAVPADLREVRSAFREAIEIWRHAVALIRDSLARLLDAVEREKRPQ